MPNPLELIAPPEMSPEELLRLKSYGYGDVLKEMFNAMGQDIKSNLRMIPEEELTPVTEITPEMYQKGMEIALAPEAGILGGVKGAKALGRLAKGKKWYHGSSQSKLTEINPSKYGDYGSAIYVTKDRDLAEMFANDLAYTQKRGTKGKVFDVGFKEPKKMLSIDDATPLTKEEVKYWESSGEALDRGATRRDLIDNFSGRNFTVFDQKDISLTWDGFLNKFGYDAVWDGRQLALRKSSIKTIQSPLKQAILDTHRGVDPEKVWKETGWTNDPSGKWMFRIDDSGAKINKNAKPFDTTPAGSDVYRLGDLIEHPEGFKTYPEIADYNVELLKGRNVTGSMGAFVKYSPTFKNENPTIQMWEFADKKSTLLHEIQHAIQELEGFARGGSPENKLQLMVNKEKLRKDLLKAADLQDSEGKFSNKSVSSLSKRESESALIAWDEKSSKWKTSVELRKEAKKIEEDLSKIDPTGQQDYRRFAGEIFAREEAAGFKGMPGTKEGIPRDQWIIKKGKGTSFSVESKFDLKQVSGGKWKVLESGKPVAKFDNLEDAYTFIKEGGKAKIPDVQSAYEAVKTEKGYSWVEIADLRDKMGITQAEMEKIIKANPQKYHTSMGDWSLSNEHVRSGAIGGKLDSMTDRPQLLVKVNPLDESKITDLIKKTHKKHYGFSIKEE